ncbi:DUF2087 domain-containing protein [Aureimonas sp. AU40]|uniref:DUF2087 domain-containing protein n=1 Tax=Aureimonas sp. AU40 TaxID=1637747 RepID=UPI0009E6B831|nr:DUF2087 domain-containing protein [Aureimonas sp. AU40]
MTALIDASGIVTRWPRKAADKELVLNHLLRHFDGDRRYPEKEVNELLKELHTFGDWALLRRELYETGRLDRDPRIGLYWVKR